MTDLLWSDPCEDYEDNESTKSSEMFQFNQQRQTSYRYNHAAIRKFLQKNKLTSVIRGHEVQLTGVKLFKASLLLLLPLILLIYHTVQIGQNCAFISRKEIYTTCLTLYCKRLPALEKDEYSMLIVPG